MGKNGEKGFKGIFEKSNETVKPIFLRVLRQDLISVEDSLFQGQRSWTMQGSKIITRGHDSSMLGHEFYPCAKMLKVI